MARVDPAERLPLEVFQQCIRAAYDRPPFFRGTGTWKEHRLASIEYMQTVEAAGLVSRQWREGTDALRGTHVVGDGRLQKLMRVGGTEKVEVLIHTSWPPEEASQTARAHKFSGLETYLCDDSLTIVPGPGVVVRLGMHASTWPAALDLISPAVRQLVLTINTLDTVDVIAGRRFENIATLCLDLGGSAGGLEYIDMLSTFPSLRFFQLCSAFVSELPAFFSKSSAGRLGHLEVVELVSMSRGGTLDEASRIALPNGLKTLRVLDTYDMDLSFMVKLLTALPPSHRLGSLDVGGRRAWLDSSIREEEDGAIAALKTLCFARGITTTFDFDSDCTHAARNLS